MAMPLPRPGPPRKPACGWCRDDPTYRETKWSLSDLWPRVALCPYCKGGLPDVDMMLVRTMTEHAAHDPCARTELERLLPVLERLAGVQDATNEEKTQ